MSRSVIPILSLLAALIFAGCSEEPSREARPSDDARQRNSANAEIEQTAAPEATGGAGSGSAGRRGAPEYIVIDESESQESGVRTAQVIATAKKSSEPELRRIVENLKGKYQNFDVVSVEIMDGAAGFGRAGSAVIMYTDEGARRSGYPEGVPNERGYVLKTVD